MPSKTYKYRDVLRLIDGFVNLDSWVLMPYPIDELKDKPDEFAKAVDAALVPLIHDKWETVGEACRELSDTGGVAFVNVIRVKRLTVVNSTFIDGKQHKPPKMPHLEGS